MSFTLKIMLEMLHGFSVSHTSFETNCWNRDILFYVGQWNRSLIVQKKRKKDKTTTTKLHPLPHTDSQIFGLLFNLFLLV